MRMWKVVVGWEGQSTSLPMEDAVTFLLAVGKGNDQRKNHQKQILLHTNSTYAVPAISISHFLQCFGTSICRNGLFLGLSLSSLKCARHGSFQKTRNASCAKPSVSCMCYLLFCSMLDTGGDTKKTFFKTDRITSSRSSASKFLESTACAAAVSAFADTKQNLSLVSLSMNG